MTETKYTGIPLAKVGTWDASTGRVSITRADLAAAVAAQHAPGLRNPVLKLGHEDPRFDGEPALGRVTRLRLADKGTTLLGDFEGIPQWLSDILPDSYPDRSLEGMFGMEDAQGNTHRFALTAVALLGVTPPAITTLESLRDLYSTAPVAASSAHKIISINQSGWVR